MRFTKDENGTEWATINVKHTVNREQYKRMRDWATFKSNSDKDANDVEIAEMLDTLLSEHLANFDPEDAGYEPEPETPSHLWLLGDA